jgi:hypothetical protein
MKIPTFWSIYKKVRLSIQNSGATFYRKGEFGGIFTATGSSGAVYKFFEG